MRNSIGTIIIKHLFYMVIQFWFLLLWRATSSIKFSWNQLFADRAASCRWLRFRLSNYKILHVYNQFVQLRILLNVCDCVLFWLRRDRRVLTMVMMLCLLWRPESAANKIEQNRTVTKIQQRNSKQHLTTTATNANWISAHRDYYNIE